jgi:hypothetical protein
MINKMHANCLLLLIKLANLLAQVITCLLMMNCVQGDQASIIGLANLLAQVITCLLMMNCVQGDQASIIGGVVDYIKELQQVLRSLEAKKHRKAYAEQVLSPRPAVPAASPRPLLKSTPPLSPRVAVPISPRTPTPGSPYKPSGGGGGGAASSRPPHPATAACYMMPSPAMTPTTSSSSSSYAHDQQQQLYPTSAQPYLPTLDSLVTELAARAAGGRPAAAGLTLPDVKVEFAGPNLVLKTVSRRAPWQALKIIAALESLSLEILHVSVSTLDDTMVHSFTIKV